MTDRLSLRGGLFLGSITKNMLQKKPESLHIRDHQ